MANTATSDPRSGKLNIVVHGTVGFFLDGESVKVVIPDVDKFIIKAGTFKEEKPLDKGKIYSLDGVREAAAAVTPNISTNANIFLVGVNVEDTPFCEFDLPVPATFRSVRGMNVPKKGNWYTPEDPSQFHIPEQLALVHVLTYDFEDYRSLAIRDQDRKPFAWEPEPSFDRQTKTVNLHIYCEPECGTVTGSPPPFTKLMALFGVTVTLDTTPGNFDQPPNVYPEIWGLENSLELDDYCDSRATAQAIHPPNDCAGTIALATAHPATSRLLEALKKTTHDTTTATTPFPFCINIRKPPNIEATPSVGPTSPSSAAAVSEAAKAGQV
jgi:hypothetical protein